MVIPSSTEKRRGKGTVGKQNGLFDHPCQEPWRTLYLLLAGLFSNYLFILKTLQVSRNIALHKHELMEVACAAHSRLSQAIHGERADAHFFQAGSLELLQLLSAQQVAVPERPSEFRMIWISQVSASMGPARSSGFFLRRIPCFCSPSSFHCSALLRYLGEFRARRDSRCSNTLLGVKTLASCYILQSRSISYSCTDTLPSFFHSEEGSAIWLPEPSPIP